MKRKKRRRKKTTGSKLCIAGFAVLLLLASVRGALGEKPSKQKAGAETAALIAVSVFREPGFALPGAELQLIAVPNEASAPKMKKLKATTDARGEFVFRVPPVPMQYTLSVSAKGLKSQQKSVSIQGEERIDATFMLEQESK